MSAKNLAAKISKDNRGSTLQDSPYMILAALFLLVFSAAIGLYIAKNLLNLEKHAGAIDAAQKIYNSADLLSAGAEGSTRTLWTKIPAGYEISFDSGNITLTDEKGTVGQPMLIQGVRLEGTKLTGGKNYHLILVYTIHDGESKVTVSEP